MIVTYVHSFNPIHTLQETTKHVQYGENHTRQYTEKLEDRDRTNCRNDLLDHHVLQRLLARMAVRRKRRAINPFPGATCIRLRRLLRPMVSPLRLETVHCPTHSPMQHQQLLQVVNKQFCGLSKTFRYMYIMHSQKLTRALPAHAHY